MTRWISRPRRSATIAAFAVLFAAAAPISAESADFPDGYTAHHTYAEVQAELRALVAAHPDIVKLRSIGRSHEGRRLWMVKISDNVAQDEPEPEIYVDGGVHGREHLSTEQALALAAWLVDGYGTDLRTTAVVNSAEVWVAPLINPDGATFDISGGTFQRWRKNRQPTADTTAVGTDINRNFGFRWGCCRGASKDPSHAFYRGVRAWSTPEARRVRDFVASRVKGGTQQIRLALTIHSHGEFVMYPFGWTSEAQPPPMTAADADRLRTLATGVADRNGYTAVQAGALYRSSGTFMDWAYARHGILALTLEMAPRAHVEDGWYVPDAERSVQLARNRDALLWFLERVSWWR